MLGNSFYLRSMFQLQSCTLKISGGNLEATWKHNGYVGGGGGEGNMLECFSCFFKIQNLYCVLSRFVAMAGSGSSPQEVVTGAAEGEGTPQKEVVPVAADGEVTPQREVITVPGEGELEKRSPSPMTPGDNVEETMVSEPAAKRLKLEMEISGLATKVEQACESMNGLSAAMIQLCDRFSKECKELHSGLQSMGLQGLTNEGLIAAIVQYEGTLQNISW